jgi:hypothetical protein
VIGWLDGSGRIKCLFFCPSPNELWSLKFIRES